MGTHRKAGITLTDQMIVNRVKKIQLLEAQKDKAERQIAALRQELCTALGDTEERKAGDFVIRWTRMQTTRLNGKALKADMPDLFARYSITVAGRRFSVGRVKAF